MDIIEMIKPYGGILEQDHFVYVSGRHGQAWINKDALTPHAQLMSELAGQLAHQVIATGIEFDVLAGPAMGAVVLGQWLAWHLKKPAIYFERENHSLKPGGFLVKRGFDVWLAGKRVLLMDDVINTGHSMRLCQSLIEAQDGKVVMAAALIDRGNVSADFLSCPLVYCATYHMQTWAAKECPLCQQAVPVNTAYAHGFEYMRSQNK